MREKNLKISEVFHSVQGEGNTMGLPSVFFRLQGCNLLCGNPQIKKLPKATQDEIYESQGENAEWTCDTISVWLKGEKQTLTDVVEELKGTYGKAFLSGSQLVITGGEPMLQQDVFPEFLINLRSALHKIIRVEVETNGTIVPDEKLCIDSPASSISQFNVSPISQFNVSPKLSNSGMPEERRIKPAAIKRFVELAYGNKSIFKFVVTKEEDLNEILRDYVEPFEIPTQKVWLMPGCSNREQFEKVAPMVADICKRQGFHFSSRLQINLWNEVTGV